MKGVVVSSMFPAQQDIIVFKEMLGLVTKTEQTDGYTNFLLRLLWICPLSVKSDDRQELILYYDRLSHLLDMNQLLMLWGIISNHHFCKQLHKCQQLFYLQEFVGDHLILQQEVSRIVTLYAQYLKIEGEQDAMKRDFLGRCLIMMYAVNFHSKIVSLERSLKDAIIESMENAIRENKPHLLQQTFPRWFPHEGLQALENFKSTQSAIQLEDESDDEDDGQTETVQKDLESARHEGGFFDGSARAEQNKILMQLKITLVQFIQEDLRKKMAVETPVAVGPAPSIR